MNVNFQSQSWIGEISPVNCQYICGHNTKATCILLLDTHTQSFLILLHKLKWMSTRKTFATFCMLHVKPCCTRL